MKEIGKAAPAVGGALKTVGVGVKKAVIGTKVIQIAKYVGMGLAAFLVLYILYRVISSRKK